MAAPNDYPSHLFGGYYVNNHEGVHFCLSHLLVLYRCSGISYSIIDWKCFNQEHSKLLKPSGTARLSFPIINPPSNIVLCLFCLGGSGTQTELLFSLVYFTPLMSVVLLSVL